MVRPLICDIPWFVSRLSYSDAPRTVLAGTDFANQLVGVFPTEQEAQALVAAHNARLNEKGPASAATDPDHGSTIPEEETAMNRPSNTTVPCAMPAPDYFTAFREMDDPISRAKDLSSVLDLLVEVGEEEATSEFRGRTTDAILFIGRETHLAVCAAWDHYQELWNEHVGRENAILDARRRAAA